MSDFIPPEQRRNPVEGVWRRDQSTEQQARNMGGGHVASPHISRETDLPVLSDAADKIVEEASAKPRILPPNKMTRSDESVSHLLTEGELARLETASDQSGHSWTATLVYGACFGAFVPTITPVIRLFREGQGQLALGDFITIIFGAMLFGAAVVVWKLQSTGDTVRSICAEYRKRPQHDVD